MCVCAHTPRVLATSFVFPCSEALVRCGAYFSPGRFDLETSEGLVGAVESLLLHMNAAEVAKTNNVAFTRHKTSPRRSSRPKK